MKNNKEFNETMELMRAALDLEIAAINAGAGARPHVALGKDNKKTGCLVDSFSTLPVITCGGACPDCYALGMVTGRKSVMTSYARNTAAITLDRARTFALIQYHVTGCRFFRWHVSGDIMDADYLSRMMEVIKNSPDCKHQIFTKQYKLINEYIAANGGSYEAAIPTNCNLMFSLPICNTYIKAFNAALNPYNLPVVVVYDDKQLVQHDWVTCSGNCSDCACQNCGCWTLKNGDVLGIQKH